MLVESVFAQLEKARSGEIDAAAWKEWAIKLYFESDLLTELQALKVAQLKELLAKLFAVARGSKKAEVADEAYKAIAGVLTVMSPVDLAYSYSYEDIRTGQAQAKRLAQVRKSIEAITPDDMAAYAARWAERVAAHTAALTDPQTLLDFSVFLRSKGVDALTDDQLVRFDTLIWKRDQANIRAEQERRAKIDQVDLGDVELTVAQERHTQKNVDIWIVRLSTRVDGDTYKQLAEAAERLGGGWSRYSNGFLFWEKEDAETFAGVKDGDVSAGDRWERNRRMREERAADRLAQYAIRKDGAAGDVLAMDRLTNTVRRARIAASAEADARSDQAMAATIMSIATAQANGDALTVLANVRSAVQVAELLYLLRRAMIAGAKARGETISYGDPVRYDAADIRHAEYPWPAWNESDAREVATLLKGKRGAGDALAVLNNMIKGVSSNGMVTARTKMGADAMVTLAGMFPGINNYWTEAIRARTISYQRLERMGIDNLPILRHALRELLPHVMAPAQPDPVTVAERALIGVRIPGFFPTPADVVAKMLDYAQVEPGMLVLEPSAGKGNIVTPLIEAGARVFAVEQSHTLIAILQQKYAGKAVVVGGDFLEIPPDPVDRVVMNPPFEDGQDIAHVRHAYDFLSEGGRLVAIMGAGAFYRSDSRAVAFRTWLEDVGGEVVEDLPSGTFYHEAGTNVSTKMVLITK